MLIGLVKRCSCTQHFARSSRSSLIRLMAAGKMQLSQQAQGHKRLYVLEVVRLSAAHSFKNALRCSSWPPSAKHYRHSASRIVTTKSRTSEILEEELDITDEEALYNTGEDSELEASTSCDDSNMDGPTIEADTTVWGQMALEIVQKVLATPEMAALDLYSFRAVAQGSTLDIRLDKPEDRYGSPMLEEIEAFSRAFYRELEAALGEEQSGIIAVEISSPGAERVVRVPKELQRFKDLPMTITYTSDSGSDCHTRIVQLAELNEAEDVSVWQLANVRANRPGGKGSKLTKKQRLDRFQVPLTALQKVKLYIEI